MTSTIEELETRIKLLEAWIELYRKDKLFSKNTLTRSFAVWGYSLLAGLLIMLILGFASLIIGLLAQQ